MNEVKRLKKMWIVKFECTFNFYAIWRIEWTILDPVYMEWGTPV